MLGTHGFVEDVSAFKEEEFEFTEEKPYRLWRKYYRRDQRIPLHYHDALEILVNENVIGKTRIEGQIFDLSQVPVSVVLPNQVHAHNMKRSPGHVQVFQMSLAYITAHIHLERIFEAAGHSIQNIPNSSEQYREVKVILRKLEKAKGEDIFAEITSLIAIFEVLSRVTPIERTRSKLATQMRDIIDWTNQHFRRKISIDHIADHLGITKYYFCKYFKKITGTTYIDYLNQVRLDNAKAMLRRNTSVTEACYESGFGNLSYFIQLFKRHTGKSPKQFAKE